MRSPMTGAAAACYNPWRLQRRGHGLVEASFHTHYDEGLARMSQLIDKLEQAASGASQPLGFGTARREQIAAILLLGAVEAGNTAQAKLVIDAGMDAAIVLGSKPAKKADINKSAKALKDHIFGVWQEEAPAKDAAGSDFQVFSSDATPIGSLAGEERTNVMHVVPELDDSLLRTIDQLPVDAFLVSLADAASLTVSQLMRLARVRGVTSRWVLVQLAALPTKEELELLRDAGVGGIVVVVDGLSASDIQACKQALLELPREPRDHGKGHSFATVPQMGANAPDRRAPEPEPDDDDWEDE